MKRLKVSREGILLIKSFEGFRPRAVRHGEGWIIGYGHTLSAREGASVTEADAELLLHYDLLSVAASINDHISNALNQHQFDALASFAFSIGVDRFNGSDVLARLNDGSTTAAADALASWPDPASLSAPMRRRAERALFVSDPAAAFTLSDLLKAPLAPLPPHPPLPPATPPLATDTGKNFASNGSAFSATEPVNRYAAYSGDLVGMLADAEPISATSVPDISAGLVVVPAVTPAPTSTETAEEPAFVLTPDAADLPDRDLRAAPSSSADEPLLFPADEVVAQSPTLRTSLDTARPLHFEWRKTGSYLVMGVFGLTTFGLSVVAFRKAWLDQSSNPFLIIGAVLAILGLACVIISAWNLYRKIDRS